MRAALGAGRLRVVRQFLAEGLVLSMVGGAAGLLLARWGIALMLRLGPQAVPRLAETDDGWARARVHVRGVARHGLALRAGAGPLVLANAGCIAC